MDSLKFLLYTLARIGILIAVSIFGTVCGRIFFPAIASFMPSSAGGASAFFTDKNIGSFIAWAVMLAFLAVLFFDDGKRHAAYEEWSSVNVTITLIFMLLVYFVPCIFRDSFDENGRGRVFYELFYFPCRWLSEGAGLEYTLSIALGVGIILAALLVMYVASFKNYARKHPVILKKPAPQPAENDDDM